MARFAPFGIFGGSDQLPPLEHAHNRLLAYAQNGAMTRKVYNPAVEISAQNRPTPPSLPHLPVNPSHYSLPHNLDLKA